MRWPGLGLTLGLVLAAPVTAIAQQQAPQQQAPPAPQAQPQSAWDTLPRMQLERQFAGPLRDTIVQRWRDPIDGAICYIYLPISASHSPPTPSGFVSYGSNGIGSISCLPGSPGRAASPRPAAPATK